MFLQRRTPPETHWHFQIFENTVKENTRHCTWKGHCSSQRVLLIIQVCSEDQMISFSGVKGTCGWPSVFWSHGMRLKTAIAINSSYQFVRQCLSRWVFWGVVVFAAMTQTHWVLIVTQRFCVQTWDKAKPKMWMSQNQYNKKEMKPSQSILSNIQPTSLYFHCIATGRMRLGLIYSLWTSPAYRNRWQIDHAA